MPSTWTCRRRSMELPLGVLRQHWFMLRVTCIWICRSGSASDRHVGHTAPNLLQWPQICAAQMVPQLSRLHAGVAGTLRLLEVAVDLNESSPINEIASRPTSPSLVRAAENMCADLQGRIGFRSARRPHTIQFVTVAWDLCRTKGASAQICVAQGVLQLSPLHPCWRVH